MAAGVQRVIIFIDGSNIYWGLRYYNENNSTDHRIKYTKLVEELTQGRQRIRSYFYGSVGVPPREGQIKFHDSLKFSGFQVVVKPIKKRWNPITGKEYSIEKGVDVALVSDLQSLAWEGAYDVAVLVSGDADFVGTVEKVKYKGKIVEVASYKDSLSGELRRVADKVIFIDDIMDKIKM